MQLADQIKALNAKLQVTMSTLQAAGGGAGGASASTSDMATGPGGGTCVDTSAGSAPAAPRARITAMSSEVVDSNPYSRLMALQRMGIVKDYERIRDKTVRGARGYIIPPA